MRLRLFFSTILVPIDYLMLVASALAAYFLRFESGFVEIRPAISIIPYQSYLILSFTVPFGWLLIFAAAGLYKIEERRLFDDIPKIIFACSTGIMFVIALIFFRREFFASRFVIIAAWAFSILFVLFGRILLNFIHYLFKKRGYGILQTILLGDNKLIEILRAEFIKNPALGRRVAAVLGEFNSETREKIKDFKNRKNVYEIIYAGEPDKNLLGEILAFAQEHHLVLKYSADPFFAPLKNFAVTTIAGVPLIEIKRTRLDGWGRVSKRIFDLIGSLILIILFLPLMILIAFAIKLDKNARGPIFWSRFDDGNRLTRVGEGGKLFFYFKFRSMRHGTHNLRYQELSGLNERAGTPMVKIKNDPRVSGVGKFIRRYSLDELPEFFLVFLGKMSLVGPRPHLPEEVANYLSHHRRALSIKPGITGLAQISGRADLDFEEEIALDIYYMENWSIWLDLYILLKTPFVVLSKRGAY